MRFLLALAATALLSGCATTSGYSVKPEDAAYGHGKIALGAYRDAADCETGKAEVLARIDELERAAGRYTGIGYSGTDHGARYRQNHQEIAFGFADAALAKGCLDDADAAYRRLIEFYVGAAYSGVRDRARLGVDDVREARAGAGSATSR